MNGLRAPRLIYSVVPGALALALALPLWAGCAAKPGTSGNGPPQDSGPRPIVCPAGDVKSCPCIGAIPGVQRCSDLGDRWESCQCTPGGNVDLALPAGGRRDLGVPARDLAVPGGAGLRVLGDPCGRAADCSTRICLGVTVAGTPHTVCATPCCHEQECPHGFGCLQLGAGRYCMPSRIYPAGYTFTQLTGQSCGAGANQCKSGICEVNRDLCRGTCCTDQDCLAAPCRWSLTGGNSLRAFCDPLGIILGNGRTGQQCFSENDCRSGVCAADLERGIYACADFCCHPSQCPGGYSCGLVEGPRGEVVRACVPIPTGAGADGSACNDDGESCQGGHCVESLCRTLCCKDGDCKTGWRCLPRTTPEKVLAPVCVDVSGGPDDGGIQ